MNLLFTCLVPLKNAYSYLIELVKKSSFRLTNLFIDHEIEVLEPKKSDTILIAYKNHLINN